MFNVACIALVLSYLLVVWLRTNAFVEYVQLLHMARFFHVSDYLKVQSDGYAGNYIDFLAEYYHDSFFVRLLICPVCLSFWLGLSSIGFIGDLNGVCVAPLVLFFYLLFNKLL
jgi:hypothetical protein